LIIITSSKKYGGIIMKIELTILGLLMEENLYGYEIKKKIIERLEDYVDIKFGSIYYAIKKAVENGWVKKAGTEKDSGNPERYVYEILPQGRKYFKKLIKQYFEESLIHFDIDIVLMFLNYYLDENSTQFIKDRNSKLKNKLDMIKKRIEDSKKDNLTKKHNMIYTYIEHHLKAEMAWLKTLEK
jgi:DNA-binding PadR family transcriptional regulator